MSQKFCNILVVRASLQLVHDLTEAIEGLKGIDCGR